MYTEILIVKLVHPVILNVCVFEYVDRDTGYVLKEMTVKWVTVNVKSLSACNSEHDVLSMYVMTPLWMLGLNRAERWE